MLDDRMSRVLKAVTEEYIRTGEPVSSAAVLKRSGLDVSSATIRNDLAKLESYGFVAQPHTSAGRIPTDQGYRFYVDHLAPARLRETTKAKIDTFFQEIHRQISEVLRDTSSFVTELTAYPSVVVGPTGSEDVVKDVRLVPLGGSIVLAVAISQSGAVHQEFVDVGTAVERADLDTAERVLAAAFGGKTLDAAEKVTLKGADLPSAVRRVISPVSDRLAARGSGREVFVSGTSHMAELWNDLAMVQSLLALLDEEAALIDLMTDDVRDTHVRFGSDLGKGNDLAVVTTTYQTSSGATGRVGVIGPMRMNYPRTIRVVEEVKEGLEDAFGVDE